MVGDGVNDAAALSQADLGIAIGNGTYIAVEAADVILMNDNLWNIGMLIDLSHTIVHRIYLNFVWALGFNVLAIPIAAGALYPRFGLRLPPEVAAIAMACSSLCVLISSMLLKRYKSPYNDKNQQMEYGQSIVNKNESQNVCGCGLECHCKQNKRKNKEKTDDFNDSQEECPCADCACYDTLDSVSDEWQNL